MKAHNMLLPLDKGRWTLRHKRRGRKGLTHQTLGKAKNRTPPNKTILLQTTIQSNHFLNCWATFPKVNLIQSAIFKFLFQAKAHNNMEQTTSLVKNSILFALLLCISQISFSQEKEETKKDKWDVNTPALPFKQVSIATNEGSWISLDVSPDGSQIVFDMLGDIYTMPI